MHEVAFRKNLSRSVRQARRDRGLTQRLLAEQCGITEKYLSRIELAQVTPSAHVAFRLCDTLGSDLRQLLVAQPPPEQQEFVKIVKLLRGRSSQKLDCARRILAELFR